MTQEIVIKPLSLVERSEALALVWRVFMAFEAPEYTEEGIEEFSRSLHDEEYLAKLCLYGAFVAEGLVGVIALRSAGTHIALFFVDGAYQGQGIGRRLLETLLKDCPADTITVNSSPYAVPIYHHLGFYDIDEEQSVNGLRFVPMARKVGNTGHDV